MSNVIKIYRGDFEKIEEFHFKKTCPSSLLGQGIYLTDSLKVAGSYREKGSGIEANFLFHGHARDRTDALNQAFVAYAKRNALFKAGDSSKQKEKKQREMRAQFNRLVEEKEIVAEYIYTNAAMLPGSEPRLTVTYGRKQKVGHVTEFTFDKSEFNKSMFKVDGHISDRVFWEVMWDKKIAVGVAKSTKEEYVAFNSDWTQRFPSGAGIFKDRTGRNRFSRLVRKALIPYGYRGFEYDGGILTGGKGFHRAFCVWDEEFVNNHRSDLK